jgi:hypothetical protein
LVVLPVDSVNSARTRTSRKVTLDCIDKVLAVVGVGGFYHAANLFGGKAIF